MTRRRTLALGVSQAVLLVVLGATASGAYAAPNPPSTAQLQSAAAQLQSAQQHLADVRVQAEQATEAYNGAQVRAAAAAQLSLTAAATLQTAQQGADQAEQASQAADATAAAATAAADQAQVDQIAAVDALANAQQQMNGLLSGAYRVGGNVPMYAQLLGSDPLGFVTGRQMLDVAGQRQRDAVDLLTSAREQADAASSVAATAQQAASTQADQATQRSQDATTAAQAAQDAAEASASAAAATSAAAADATTARQHAQDLVDAAQQALGAASSTVQGMSAMADSARRDATAALSRAGGGSAAASSPAAATAISWAFKEIGVPYAWGGGNANGPTLGFAQGAGTVGFDCSGLTQFAYAHAGIRLDHYTGSQWNEGLRIPSISALLPGDLVFFATDTSNPATIHHVALYIGNGLMIQAPHTGDVVRVSPMWSSGYIGAVRPAA